ncbi:unnamed protein product [Effrenium voratum]|nr:unnamed protein product [Effrenium voratum]
MLEAGEEEELLAKHRTAPPLRIAVAVAVVAAVALVAATALAAEKAWLEPKQERWPEAWEKLPGMEEMVRAQRLQLRHLETQDPWTTTECVIDAVQAMSYLGNAVIYLWRAIQFECPDQDVGCAENVGAYMAAVSWVGAYVSMAANACAQAPNPGAACGAQWATLTANLAELAAVGAAVSDNCDFSSHWAKPHEEEEEEEEILEKFIPGAGPVKEAKAKSEAKVKADLDKAACGMDVTNSLSYLVREVLQIREAVHSCPEPRECAMSILSVLASFGWIIRFGALTAVDCPSKEDQPVACTADIADLFAATIGIPTQGLGVGMDC